MTTSSANGTVRYQCQRRSCRSSCNTIAMAERLNIRIPVIGKLAKNPLNIAGYFASGTGLSTAGNPPAEHNNTLFVDAPSMIDGERDASRHDASLISVSRDVTMETDQTDQDQDHAPLDPAYKMNATHSTPTDAPPLDFGNALLAPEGRRMDDEDDLLAHEGRRKKTLKTDSHAMELGVDGSPVTSAATGFSGMGLQFEAPGTNLLGRTGSIKVDANPSTPGVTGDVIVPAPLTRYVCNNDISDPAKGFTASQQEERIYPCLELDSGTDMGTQAPTGDATSSLVKHIDDVLRSTSPVVPNSDDVIDVTGDRVGDIEKSLVDGEPAMVTVDHQLLAQLLKRIECLESERACDALKITELQSKIEVLERSMSGGAVKKAPSPPVLADPKGTQIADHASVTSSPVMKKRKKSLTQKSNGIFISDLLPAAAKLEPAVKKNESKARTTAKPKASYAEALKRNPEKIDSEKNSKESIIKSIRAPVKKGKPKTSLTELCRLYFSGFAYMRITQLKEKLKIIGLDLSDIPNISYVGKDTLELLVTKAKSAKICAILEDLGFRRREKFDPEKPADATASPDTVKKIRLNFFKRLERLAECKHPIIRAYYADWLETVKKSSHDEFSTMTTEIPTVSQC